MFGISEALIQKKQNCYFQPRMCTEGSFLQSQSSPPLRFAFSVLFLHSSSCIRNTLHNKLTQGLLQYLNMYYVVFIGKLLLSAPDMYRRLFFVVVVISSALHSQSWPSELMVHMDQEKRDFFLLQYQMYPQTFFQREGISVVKVVEFYSVLEKLVQQIFTSK